MYNLFDNDAWKQRGNASNVLTAEQIAQRGQAIDAQQRSLGSKPSFDDWYKTVPSDRNDTSIYNLRRAYELAPMDELEKWRTATPEQLKDDNYHLRSVYFDPNTGIGEFMKSRNHPTLQGELDYYYGNSPEAKAFRDNYSLDTSGEYYRYIPKNTANVQQAQTPPATQSQGTVAFTPGNQAIVPKETNPQRTVGYDIPTPVYKGGVTPNGGMDYLASLYTSPEQEERLRKASVNRQRILAVGDALRHIGNIYHTVNYAPSQQFNKPWEDEYTRYQTQKTVRDKANQKYLAYQQAKAAQDAKQKQWEATFAFNAAKDEREAARKERLADAQTSRWNAQSAKDEASKAYWDTRARLLEAGWPLDKAIKEAKKAEIDERTRLTKIKADQGGWAPKKSGGGGGRGGSGGGKYWFKDEDGNFHYYPNKTMWEVGVKEYGGHLPQRETYSSSGPNGETKREKAVNPTTTAAQMANNAKKKQEAKKQAAQAKTKAKAQAKKGTTNGKKIKVNW